MSAQPLTLNSSVGALTLSGFEGICLPSTAGDAADHWYRLLSLKLRKVMPQVLTRAAAEAPSAWAPGTQQARELLLSLSPAQWLSAFGSPIAYQPLDNSESLEGLGIKDPLSWSMALPRFVFGAPDVPEMKAVVPAEVMADSGLYLPHLHALLAPGCVAGPVLLEADYQTLRVTWIDGQVLTLPREPQAIEAIRDTSVPRFKFLPKILDWPVLNSVPEARSATARYWHAMRGSLVRAQDVAQGWQPGRSEAEIFEQGLALLEQIWPEAAAGVIRGLRGVVFLPHNDDGHYHSYSTVKLHGALMMTALNRVQVADVLVHEMAHTRMSPLFELDPLIEDDGQAVHPSPWRTDPRPLKGLLNGVQAFANVHHFYQRLPALPDWPVERSAAILSEQREKLTQAWTYLKAQARPTPVGQILFDELDTIIGEL